MKYVSLSFLLSISLLFCGCYINPFVDNHFQPSTAWHAQDLDTFLIENYPEGTDEKKLISDFILHHYEYSSYNCSSPQTCNKNLSAKGYCSWMKGAQETINISWKSDSEGKIKTIKSFKSYCVLSP